ncbi:hypothetical protein ACQP2T_61890 [Nonomuraea sp. CA-143628]|uniref:hypothetical protein n=1 Tax=Nonomuraea sp. CA-143628 TaxID=3239997 RepID=UPI003D940295
MSLIMDALWWIGLVCVPASIIRRATRDGQRQHPTPADRWNDRPHSPWPTTWTRRALRAAYHLGRALGWTFLLLVWITIGLTLAAFELSGGTCKALAYAVAGIAIGLAYLVQHAKGLMDGPAPTNAPHLTA